MFVRRLDYRSTWGMLQAFGLVAGDAPPQPTRRSAEVPAGPADNAVFWRLDLHDRNLSGLTLAGWLVGRSRADVTLFQDTDFSGAAILYCEFDGCDFRGGLFRDADLRGSSFEGCRFDGADLSGADLRGASFGRGCTFDGASLKGARALESQRGDLAVSPAQAASVTWFA